MGNCSLCLILRHLSLGGHWLSLSTTYLRSLLTSKAPQQASTSWACVGEEPSFPWEPLPDDDMPPPGRPGQWVRLNCPPIKTRTPHAPWMQSLSSTGIIQKTWHNPELLRYKQNYISCPNLYKIPANLESEHFPKCT